MQEKNITTSTEGFIDTHFHSREMASKGIQIHKLYSLLFKEKKYTFGLDICTDPESFPEHREFSKGYPKIYHAIGLPPKLSARKESARYLGFLESHLQNPSVIALGEIGMDFHWNYGTQVMQESLFKKQINVANNFGLPIIVHNRKADQSVLSVLEKQPPKYGGIIHCFSSSPEYIPHYLHLGFYISFAGNITFKNADNIRQAAQKVPLDRLLIETDAPFLTPHPYRGKINTPEYISYTYDSLAHSKNVTGDILLHYITKNVEALFGIKL